MRAGEASATRPWVNNPISQTRRQMLSVWAPFGVRLPGVGPICGQYAPWPAWLYGKGCPIPGFVPAWAAYWIAYWRPWGHPESVPGWHRLTCTGCCTGSVSVPWCAAACSAVRCCLSPLPSCAMLATLPSVPRWDTSIALDRTWSLARMYCPGNRLASYSWPSLNAYTSSGLSGTTYVCLPSCILAAYSLYIRVCGPSSRPKWRKERLYALQLPFPGRQNGHYQTFQHYQVPSVAVAVVPSCP